MNTASDYRLSRQRLGPIFYRFLLRLQLTQRAYDPQETHLLFLSRGGIRLRRFYQEFLVANELAAPLVFDDLYVSRMALIKAVLLGNYESAYEDLAQEYWGASCSDFVGQFFGDSVGARWRRQADPRLCQDAMSVLSLQELIWGDGAASDVLRQELLAQEQAYHAYLDGIVGERSRVVVVDTGWSGSILRYMALADPGRDYTALFFGRYNYGKPNPPWFDRVLGLAAEGTGYRRSDPSSAVFLHRHLIEGLCEIEHPSATGYTRVGAEVVPAAGKAAEEHVLPSENEIQATAVLDHIRAAHDGVVLTAVNRSADRAAHRLRRSLHTPSRNDIEAFVVPPRSADFGRDLAVPVLIAPALNDGLGTRRRRIRASLWPQAQIRLEFGPWARPVQLAYGSEALGRDLVFRTKTGLRRVRSSLARLRELRRK